MLERTTCTIPCTMADGCKFTFSSAIRGFHVYGKTWSPHIGQQLQTMRQYDNAEDRFAVAVVEVREGGS